jgi:MSHA biogenesis protein MshN
VVAQVTPPEKKAEVTIVPASPIVAKTDTKDADESDVVAESPANDDFNKTIRPLTTDQQSQLAFQRAVKMLGRGKQQAAQLALEESLSFAPTHMRARETLAALLLNEGRVSEAASSLRDGLQLMAGATPLAKLYARILVDQGDITTAVSVLERAQPAVSADPEYYALLAALYRQEKKHAQAARTYQQILMQRPGVASWWMGLALSEDAMGESAQALNAFQRAQRAGGLSAEVMKYVQARIDTLAPIVPAPVKSRNVFDDFGE